MRRALRASKNSSGNLAFRTTGIKLVAGGNVAAALHQFILRIHRLAGSLGVFANHVLKHDHIAGLPHRIIRLRGNDQSESLKVGGHVQFAAMVVADQHFAQVHGPAFGRNRPQHVGQILVAESRRLLQVAEIRVDLRSIRACCSPCASPFAEGIRSVPAKSSFELPLRCS